MSKREKMALWVAGAIAFIVLLWILWNRRQESNPPASAAQNPVSYYMTYNYPGTQPWKASANGLPSIPAIDMGGGDGCGCCGCGDSGAKIFSSVNNMLDYFTSKSRDIFDRYQDQVYSGYPDSLTQFFNNPAGANMSSKARAVFKG